VKKYFSEPYIIKRRLQLWLIEQKPKL